MALNLKSKRFCEFYAVSFNAAQSALDAGYAEKSARTQGQRILKRPEAQEYIAKLQAQAAEQFNINKDDIVKKLRENYKNAKEAGHFTACNQALQLEAKIGGLMTDTVHLTGIEITSDSDLIEKWSKGDAKKATLLREMIGAPDTFDTPETRH